LKKSRRNGAVSSTGEILGLPTNKNVLSSEKNYDRIPYNSEILSWEKN